jgi:arginyl-tRNA synthetase
MLMLQEIYKTIGNVIQKKTGVTDAQLIDGGEHADLATTIAFTLAKQ